MFQGTELSDNRLRFAFPIPSSRVFSELTAALWVRSTCANVQLGVRLRFPHQLDPSTGEPLKVDLLGNTYGQPREWQQLRCTTTDDVLSSRLIRLRKQLQERYGQTQLDEREPYVDQLLLLVQPLAGRSYLQVDDLEFGPVVAPQSVGPRSSPPRPIPTLTVGHDRIRKGGEPFFITATVYHGESLDLVARTGVNTLWIPDYQDRPLLTALAEMNIGAIARPPQPTAEQAMWDRAGIPRLAEWTSPVVAWMLGSAIPAEDRMYVTGWSAQVRNADRDFKRPILADVAGQERDFHRSLDLLASSRFGIHTVLSPAEHFEQLRGRRDFALPGKPMFTILQTEATDALLDYMGERETIPIVEPEQILHQAYAAIAAGFKGVLFWKQIPFDADGDGLDERLQAIRIFSIHSRILDPFLATGRVMNDIPLQIDPPSLSRDPNRNAGRNSNPRFDGLRPRVHRPNPLKGDPQIASPLKSIWDRPLTQEGRLESEGGPTPQIRATLLQSDYGLLILPVWYEPGGQCVPGPQTAHMVRMLLRGVPDGGQAWEVTPTSIHQANLDMQRVAGGPEITLKEFDQHTVIVMTSTTEEAENLRRRVFELRHDAAEAYVQLAESKLARVTKVHQELAGQAPPISNAETLIQRANAFVDQAQRELDAGRADEARIASCRALQSLRTLQREHWEQAVDLLDSPTESLDACSFQTLPVHWQLHSELEQRVLSANLLPTGDFEGQQQLQNQWIDGSSNDRFASLHLSEGGAEGRRHMSMLVRPEAPAGESAVVISPAVDVSVGDLVIITGRFHLPYPLPGPEHQFLVFDTLAGRGGALRFTDSTADWKSFRLIRRASKSGELRVRFELQGPGIVGVDDVQVRKAQLAPR